MTRKNRASRAAQAKQLRELEKKVQQPIEKQGQAQAIFPTEPKRTGLLVTEEFEKCVEECKKRVRAIAKDCRSRNRKFRDIEFDAEFDRDRCLHGVGYFGDFDDGDSDDEDGGKGPTYRPPAVQRVTQLFENPSFFVDGPDSSDVQQGALGDCWLLSALATLATTEGLIDKFCVERDEQVGVYGFIFFRDSTWVSVIIDDLLYTSIPKFEELSREMQMLYHYDKESYNKSARKSGKGLYFARSGTHGETWVPLVEKAYAKLHGNYLSLHGGHSGEAVEDLTGGVNTTIATKDILDKDQFWESELRKANIDRLFACALDELDTGRSGNPSQVPTVNGLYGGHAYSVLKAIEHNGKRFVIVRNPWGKSEWTGKWSDGSKEWTEDWLPALKSLGHTFGNDGQFVMENNDFLENWEYIDRIRLFDDSWVMSSQWLNVNARPSLCAWSYGDVSFTIKVESQTPSIIVLSQVDSRFYRSMNYGTIWSFDFVVFRKGEVEPLCSSNPSVYCYRSANAEVTLAPGDYVVHVRLNAKNSYSQIMTERALAASVASNVNKSIWADYLPVPLSTLAGQDLSELEEKARAANANIQAEQQALRPEGGSEKQPEDVKEGAAKETPAGEVTAGGESVVFEDKGGARAGSEAGEIEAVQGFQQDVDRAAGGSDEEDYGAELGFEGQEPVTLGLRVYTLKDAPATIEGQLRREMNISFEGLAINAATDT